MGNGAWGMGNNFCFFPMSDISATRFLSVVEGQHKCPMPDAPCPMPNAQCPMPHAQFPMPNSRCPMP
ncbi:MAG: hypothetical protein WCD53_04150 [Microcoleus sp.]